MDIIWLQRDLGLYVVNLFDTFHASRALAYPQKSLAYLLKTFANVDAAKQYQTADWRIRPLPEAMFDYARSDTHYLLYIFDNMRNALIEKAGSSRVGETPIDTVMNNSKEVALQRYERYFYDYDRGSGAAGWYNMLNRTPALFNREQFAVFRAVHQWRDDIARLEDESLQAVISRKALYNIAREVPMDIPSLLGCSHPMSKIFQNRKEELLEVIKRAKALGENGPDMREVLQEIDSLLNQSAAEIKILPTMSLNSAKTENNLMHSIQRTETLSALKADSSNFWGPHMSNAESAEPMMERQCHSLVLPIIRMDAEFLEESGHTSQRKNDQAESSPSLLNEFPNVENSLLNKPDVFILKEDGGSRKRKATLGLRNTAGPRDQANDAVASWETANDVGEQALESERKRVKSERKAEKKRLKKAKMEEANQSMTYEEETLGAFDYGSAPSMLHAKEARAGRTAPPNQGFNPYAKSMDAPKSARNTKKETAGKSHTFSS